MSGGQVHVDPETVFTRFLRGKGCHNTQQRRAIVSVFFQEEGHLTIDDLYGLVQRQDPTVGQSTVYRTMKLLCEAGLAKEVSFGGASSGMSRPATGTTIISSASAAARALRSSILRSKPCRSVLSANTDLRPRNTGCICTASVRSASLDNLLQNRL